MSRIHEALKKAEQDRALMPDNGSVARRVSPAAVIDAGPPGTVPSVSSPATLKFEELCSRCAHPKWNLDSRVNVFADPTPSAQGAEQFRTLRSRLYQLRSTQQMQKLLVTSSVPGEGKTFVTTNLSQSIIRQPERRVLMIDADLRASRLHIPLGAPSGPGLSDYLSGKADEAAVIQHGQDGNLCFIAGGSQASDPSELLSNGRLKMLLDLVSPIFDWVIFDSPPCLPVADANILSNYCDGVVMVVRAGVTATEVAQRACQELQGKNILGVVLNAVEESHMYGTYYYQAYGYGQPYGSKTTSSSN